MKNLSKKAEEVLAIFGEEYSKGVHAAFTERWIDVHPNKGKRSGAYSGGAYDTKCLHAFELARHFG